MGLAPEQALGNTQKEQDLPPKTMLLVAFPPFTEDTVRRDLSLGASALLAAVGPQPAGTQDSQNLARCWVLKGGIWKDIILCCSCGASPSSLLRLHFKEAPINHFSLPQGSHGAAPTIRRQQPPFVYPFLPARQKITLSLPFGRYLFYQEGTPSTQLLRCS